MTTLSGILQDTPKFCLKILTPNLGAVKLSAKLRRQISNSKSPRHSIQKWFEFPGLDMVTGVAYNEHRKGAAASG